MARTAAEKMSKTLGPRNGLGDRGDSAHFKGAAVEMRPAIPAKTS
jgi:hypothetical protein